MITMLFKAMSDCLTEKTSLDSLILLQTIGCLRTATLPRTEHTHPHVSDLHLPRRAPPQLKVVYSSVL